MELFKFRGKLLYAMHFVMSSVRLSRNGL